MGNPLEIPHEFPRGLPEIHHLLWSLTDARFIYGAIGRPAWRLGTEALFHKFVPLGFLMFSGFLGTGRSFIRIVPHGLSLFGHSSWFFKKRSKLCQQTRGTIDQNLPPVPNPVTALQNPRGTNFNSSLLCPILGNPWGTFLQNSLLCPNAHARRLAPP